MGAMLKSRTFSYILLGMLGLMFIGMCVSIFFSSGYSEGIDAKIVSINGKYSVDGGEWKDTVPGKMVEENFSEVKIKGTLSTDLAGEDVLIISARNIWFDLKTSNNYHTTNFRANDETALKNTPGYSINYVHSEFIRTGTKVELTLKNPYPMFSVKNLDNFFELAKGNGSTLYEMFIQSKTPLLLGCILICLFGLIAFPIAGFVIGGIDYRYLSFGIMCFFAGVYIFFDDTDSYIQLWIHNEVLCMVTDVITNYMFAISAAIYIKTNLQKDSHKTAANLVLIGLAGAVTAISLLHMTGTADYYATEPYMLIFIALSATVCTVCIIREAISKNREAISVLISWIPIFITLILDGINSFVYFWHGRFIPAGVAITLVYQLVMLIIDLRAQYKEAIRYQEVQKELYEARVSIMVSQIQPHFLYNSLTSIAMMCTKDPQLAKKATINFADYLRGNMNSLKEKNPVPFRQELEHLKKYLMLEQMRFGDMLNIEYDIQATDFVLPQLSVQPLVENAVKHGVGMKEDGGTVKISTRETPEFYEVIVSDDGVGFDTSAPPKNDGRSHVGMENVKQRLKDMCDAEVVIESEIGKGTVSTIFIPKEDTK